jgi:hypothetical protein
MSKGYPRGLSRGAPGLQEIVRQKIRLVDLAISIAGASGVGFGSAVAGDLPKGNILFLGAIAYLRVSEVAAGDADVVDTFTGNFSVGSTATADATLDTTDANFIASTALAAATAGVSPVTRGASAADPSEILNNTDGSLEVNLNVTIADASISGTGSMLVNGYIELVYMVLGDDELA